MTARLGFVGLGWIGRNRLEALVQAGAQPAAYLEPDPTSMAAAQDIERAPAADDLDGLLSMDLDGVVIATPNALHAPQSVAALERGLPVFCQKPLSPRHEEALQVVETAREQDRLLDVDWSYRGSQALAALQSAYQSGAIGDCYRAELAFHNAYGPDKSWYRDSRQAGGGCLVDLGCHLLDALHWVLGPDATRDLHVRHAGMYARGDDGVRNAPRQEDHAVVHLAGGGLDADLACSWNVPNGGDCSVHATFYGPRGVLRFENVGGSFYDFQALHRTSSGDRMLAVPPDPWMGRQASRWADRVADGDRDFDEAAWQTVENARLLEEAYRCAS